MKHYKGKCNQCGKCCEVIPIANHKSITEWKEWLSKYDISKANRPLTNHDNDHIFIANNFIELKKEELPETINYQEGAKYYKCLKLKDNKCTAYSERPSICKGYPNYTSYKLTSPVGLINKVNCGYTLIE